MSEEWDMSRFYPREKDADDEVEKYCRLNVETRTWLASREGRLGEKKGKGARGTITWGNRIDRLVRF